MNEEYRLWKVVEVNQNGMKVKDLVRLLEGVDPNYSVYMACREQDSGCCELVSGVNVSGVQRWFMLLPVGQDYEFYKNSIGCDYIKE